MNECKRDHISLPNSFSFCPYCGSKIDRSQFTVLSDTEVNEALLKLAQTWDKNNYKSFFVDILKLKKRVAYPLLRGSFTPEQVITMTRSDFQNIRLFGRVAIEQEIRNRLSYTG